MSADRRLVLIWWNDSHGSDGWEILPGKIEDQALVCTSVGWLLLDGEQVKVLAPTLSQEHATVPFQGSGVMTIPTCAVIRLVDLAEVGGG